MAETERPSTLWAGRFKHELIDIAHRFSSSIALDGRLYREDIEGSLAHVTMLGESGILPRHEVQEIASGLRSILADLDTRALRFEDTEEDIHLAVERELMRRIGPVGGKLHTGRSRNDQVALDERLYLKRSLPGMAASIRTLQQTLVQLAESHTDVIMPGYTHLQRAQPVLFAHHLLAYVSMFERDRERLQQCLSRVDRSPLGAAAFAGTSFPIDREQTASLLGFSGVVHNSMDAVADRDYLIELAAVGSIVMMHLSRMAEELILWSSKEFGFVELSDAVTTGSSIMPQKKNSDMAELVRGKTGRVYGALINLLTIMKGLPMAYNRDMQEDKQPMFDVVDTTTASLDIMSVVLEHTHINAERMRSETELDFMTATEIADYLAAKGLPFREAHAVAGRIVAYCVEQRTYPIKLTLSTLQEFSTLIEEDIFVVLDPATSVARKRSAGSTSPTEVKHQIAVWKEKFVESIPAS